MPSKSSHDISLHKVKGFHLKHKNTRKSQSITSLKFLNPSNSIPSKLQETGVRAIISDSHCTQIPSSSTKTPKQIERIAHLDAGLRKIKIQKVKSLQTKSRKDSENKLQLGDKSKSVFKHFCTLTVKKNKISKTLLKRKYKDLVVIRNSIKTSQKSKSNLPNELTIEPIKYKCRILQFHDQKCNCSSPRLHVYLTTNHRCGDNCPTEPVLDKDISTESTHCDSNKQRYIFKTMTGKSKVKRCTRKVTNVQRASKSPKRKVKNSSLDKSSAINSKLQGASKKNLESQVQQEEPESELLGEVCESLPTIMNSLSSDVEYVVLDDDTFNLAVNSKSSKLNNATDSKKENKQKIKAIKDKINIETPKYETVFKPKSKKLSAPTRSFIPNSATDLRSKCIDNDEDEDVKPDIKALENVTVFKAKSKDSGNILERYLSEKSNKSSRNDTLKTNQLEEGSCFKTTDASSLAEICTNHCPSLKDIFGDIQVKDEPIDEVDNNDMSIEDFSKEIKKLTEGNNEATTDWPVSQLTSLSKQMLTSKESFAGLLKDDVKTPEDASVPNSTSETAIKQETTINDDNDENDGYSTDSSLGPLQIDEGEPEPEKPETEVNTVQIPSIPANSLILPSVNIISPFKIKIFFGPQQIQINKPHDIFNNTITVPVINQSNTNQQKNKEGYHNERNELSDMDTKPSLFNQKAISLTCIYCNVVSPDIEALAQHFEEHSKQGLIICYFCQKSFGDKTSVKRHMRTHTGEKPYQCKVCGKRFSLPGNFKKHRDIHEDIRTEPCELCGKTFRRKEHLKYHMRTHTGEKPYVCTACGASFTARYSLQIHMNIHLGKKPYKCSYCNKAFSDKSTMRKHVRVHTGEKPFSCGICGKRFGESGTLASHMATHSSDRPHKCTMCSLSFKTNGGLRQHERVHKGDKQFACNYCGAKFLQKYNMTMHERIHTGEKPYQCDQCDRSFRSRSCLAKHIVLHGGNEERRYECSHCPSRFYRKAHLRRHIDMHLGIKHYECEQCSKKFVTRNSRDNHIKIFHTQNARRFPCNWCGRVFKRKVYINTHECIRDPEKVEQYKKEMQAKAAAAKTQQTSQETEEQGNVSDSESIDIKNEPEDQEVYENPQTLEEIKDLLGNVNFNIHEAMAMIKPEPS